MSKQKPTKHSDPLEAAKAQRADDPTPVELENTAVVEDAAPELQPAETCTDCERNDAGVTLVPCVGHYVAAGYMAENYDKFVEGLREELAKRKGPTVSEQAKTVVVAAPSETIIRSWRPIKACTVYLNGQQIRLTPNKILREDSYSPGTIDRFIAAGAELEQIT